MGEPIIQLHSMGRTRHSAAVLGGYLGFDNVGLMHVILPGWQTPNGIPELGSGSPSGQFAQVTANGYTLTSPAFTVEETAQTISWSEIFP